MLSKVKQNLLKVSLNVGNFKLAAHIALTGAIEYDNVVNLDNAYGYVEEKMTRNDWRAALSQLGKEGSYKSLQGEFSGSFGILPNYNKQK